MRSIENRLLLRSTSGRLLPTGRKKGRKNKNARPMVACKARTIITILFALVAMVGISNAFDFGIDDEDVTIAVNKNIAGNDIPDEKTAVGEATLAVRFLETESGHVGVNHNLCGGGGEVCNVAKRAIFT